MTKTKIIKPADWACSLNDCPPGSFVPTKYPNQLWFKSDYCHIEGHRAINKSTMAFNEAGEFLCLEETDDQFMVWPVEMVEEE